MKYSVLLLLAVVFIGFVDGEKVSCGGNVLWELYSNGVLEVSGSGEMAKDCKTAAWAAVKKIIIDEGVTSISDNCFQDMGSVTQVTIASSVSEMGVHAFPQNRMLEIVEIPSNSTLRNIGAHAFQNCFSLKNISIPSRVEIIGPYAFYECFNLTTISIPDSVSVIQAGVFQNCISLESIDLPNSLKSIPNDVFNNCPSLTSIEIPSSVSEIGENTFRGCSKLSSIVFNGNNISQINSYDFCGCANLESISIPHSVKTIKESAFENCTKMNNVTLNDGLEKIYKRAFANCGNLSSIIIPSTVKSINESAFSGCVNLQNIAIPENVTYLGDNAFENCCHLEWMEYEGLQNPCTDGAFPGCNELKYIRLSPSYNDSDFCRISSNEGFHLVNNTINDINAVWFIRDNSSLVEVVQDLDRYFNNDTYLVGDLISRKVLDNKTRVINDMSIVLVEKSLFNVIVIVLDDGVYELNSTAFVQTLTTTTDITSDQILFNFSTKDTGDVSTITVYVTVDLDQANNAVDAINQAVQYCKN